MTLPVPDDEPGKLIADKTPWKLAKTQADRARLCIRAAEMRSKGKTYVQIAELLGMDSPQAAKKCAEVGYGLAPGDDLRTGRRRAAEELDLMRRELWDVIDDPGVKISPNGSVVIDPRTGQPALDRDAKTAAIRTLAEVNKQYRTLLGTDAPKLSASLSATGSLEDIRAEIERRRAELEQAEREQVPGDDDGYPALPPAYPGDDSSL